jgi:hypothetical protein
MPLGELGVSVVVGFTWWELEGLAGGGGFAKGKRVDEEAVGTVT